MTRLLFTSQSERSSDDVALARASDYIRGTMSDEEVKRFEADLVDDPEFFELVAPFISLWRSAEPLPILKETLAEVDIDIARAKERRAATEARREQRAAFWGGVAASLAGLFTIKSMLAVGGTVAVASLAWLMTPRTPQPTTPPTQLVAQHPDTTLTIGRPPTGTTTKTPPRGVVRRSPLPQQVAVLPVPALDTAGNAVASKLVTPLPGIQVARVEPEALGTSPGAATLMGGYWAGDRAPAAAANPVVNGPEDAQPQAKPDDHRSWWSWLDPRNWHRGDRPTPPPTPTRGGHLR